jgi:hypothetical protein
MRRFLKLLARLYPVEWRRRYGVEYEALLEEREPRVRDVFDVLLGAINMQMTTWSFARIVLVCSLVGALVAVGISFAQPRMYMSQTVISVEAAGPQVTDRYIAGLLKDWLSPESLTSIIERENLYPVERARMPMKDVIDLMRKNIWVQRPVQEDAARGFVVRFNYPNPQVAQRVDQELSAELLTTNLHSRQNDPASHPAVTFAVREAANLPQKPYNPSPGEFGARGLIVGLAGGIVAGVVARRRRLTVANG